LIFGRVSMDCSRCGAEETERIRVEDIYM
jgi:hypothetical protein